MARLTPVDYDPFAQPATAGVRLVPVDYNPFAPAQPRTASQELSRAFGLLGRNALEGAGGFLGLVTDPVATGLGRLTGQTAPSLRSLAAQAADAAGLPRPENRTERIIGDVQQAVVPAAGMLSLSARVAQAASPLVASIGQQLTMQPGMQLTGAATGSAAGATVREDGGTQGAQIGASLLGAIAPSVGHATAAEVVRRTVRGGEAGRQVMQKSRQDFAAAGATPTVGQASPGTGGKIIEAGLRRAPGSVGVMTRQLEAQAEDIGRRVNQLADSLSPAAGAEKGGSAVIRGITGDGGFMERFRATSGALYDKVEQLLPPNTMVPAQSSVAMLRSLTAPVQGAERTAKVLQNAKVASIAKAFSDDLAENGGQLPYHSLKALRTEVGKLMDDSVLSPDISVRKLARLYGAMTEDMTRAAVATGDQATIRAANRANMFYRVGQKRVEALQDALSREAGGPEAVYKAMFNNSREGGTKIRRVMQSLTPQQQKDFAAATLRRLGRANPGVQDETFSEVFSTERFLTNLATMSPQARAAIFDRFGAQFRGDLDRIASATARIRESIQTQPNPSGTTPSLVQVGAYGGLAMSAIALEPTVFAAIAAAMGASNAAGRAFTNPKVVRWIATQTQAPVAALPAALAQLARIAEKDEDAAALLEEINRTGVQTSPQATTPRIQQAPGIQPPAR